MKPPAIAAAALLLAAGCASSPDRKLQEENKALKEQVQGMRTVVRNLNSRIETLEGRLTSIGEKSDRFTAKVESLLENQKARSHPVVKHPGEAAGAEVAVEPPASDPEAGFVSDEAVRLYRKAMVLSRGGRHPEAILAFTSFVERYPDHPLAGAAQFHVGESYASQREYKLAHQELKKVLTSYDRSSHVAQALQAIASVEDALQKPEDAARHRQLLTSLFPQSPAAAAPTRVEQAEPATAQPSPEGQPARPAQAPGAEAAVDPVPAAAPDAHGTAGVGPAPLSLSQGRETAAAALDSPPPTAPMGLPGEESQRRPSSTEMYPATEGSNLPQ